MTAVIDLSFLHAAYSGEIYSNMSQNGDSPNIIRPPFRRYTPAANGASPGAPIDRPAPDLRLPQPPAAQPGRASAPRPGLSQPAAADPWTARRRNQWRQQQQLSAAPPPPSEARSGASAPPSAGPPSPPARKPLQLPSPPPHAVAAAAAAVNPRFKPITVQPPGPGPAGIRPAGALPVRPASLSPERPPLPASPPRPSSKVTPLHRRSGSRLAVPERREDRPPRPRRKPPRPPLPMLYAIRLLILGVGVAAIAGTLLSTLSPSQLTASNLAPAAQESPASGVGLGLRGRPAAASAQSIPLATEVTRLKSELEQLTTLTPGLTQATFLLDLDTGNYVDVAGSRPIAAASTIKVPILVAFLQAVDGGSISLDQAMTLDSRFVAGGSGNFQDQPLGTQFTALEVASQMIITSDNTATNMIIDLLGGAEVLNQKFAAWGLSSTALRNPLPDLEGTNTTSPRDLALLMALVDRGDLTSVRSRDRLFSILQRTQNRSLIPSGINDQGAIVANKTGDIAAVLGDVALIDTAHGKRYVVATLIQRPDNDGRAGELIRRIAERINRELNQPVSPTGATAPAPIPPGADGLAPQEGFTAPSRPPTAPGGARNAPRVRPDNPAGSGVSPTPTPAEAEPTPGDRIPQG